MGEKAGCSRPRWALNSVYVKVPSNTNMVASVFARKSRAFMRALTLTRNGAVDKLPYFCDPSILIPAVWVAQFTPGTSQSIAVKQTKSSSRTLCTLSSLHM